jgi:hypothetical protein
MVDDLVLFHDVKGIRSAARALFCWIEEQSVRLARLPRLPRRHIRGRLASPRRSLSGPHRVGRLHLVRGAGKTQHAN